MFGGPRLVRRPLGIIHVTDVYVVFRLRRYKFWLSRAPGYLGTRDEKSGLNPDAAHFREAQFGGPDASRDHAENSVKKLRTQRGVAHAVGFQRGPINLQGGGVFARPNLKQRVLIVQQGAPAEHIAWAQCLHRHDVLPPAQLHHYTAGQQKEEGCRACPIDKNDFVLRKLDPGRDSGQTLDLCFAEPLGECMISEDLFLWHMPQPLCENPHLGIANPFRMPKYTALRHEKSNPAAKSSAACSNPAESRGDGLRCDAGVHVTCRKCKVPMQEIKGHIYHRKRKWKCPKCAKIRMQKAAHR